MIPELTFNALKIGFGHFGVSSNDNKTRHVDTLGVKLNDSGSSLTCFVLKSECQEVIDFLKSAGRISFFVGMISHEAYNFKGQFIELKSLNDDDLNIVPYGGYSGMMHNLQYFNYEIGLDKVSSLYGRKPKSIDIENEVSKFA